MDGSQLLLQLFVAALGCAVAWGMIDGAMYVLTCVFERGKDRRLYRLVRNAQSQDDGVAVLSDELDDDMGPLTTSTERRQIYTALYDRLRSSPPPRGGFAEGGFRRWLRRVPRRRRRCPARAAAFASSSRQRPDQHTRLQLRCLCHAVWHGLPLGTVCRRQTLSYRPDAAHSWHPHDDRCHSVRRLEILHYKTKVWCTQATRFLPEYTFAMTRDRSTRAAQMFARLHLRPSTVAWVYWEKRD